jgi:hypothetical protein
MTAMKGFFSTPVTAELVRIALKGENDHVRVRAIEAILNRAGMSERQILEADVTHRSSEAELDAEIRRLVDQIKGNDRFQRITGRVSHASHLRKRSSAHRCRWNA